MKAVFKSTGTKDSLKDSVISFGEGDIIFSEGDLGTEMYIIQEGEVEIVKRLGSESHVLSHLEKGDFFGEMAVVDNIPRSADAVARSAVRCVAINGSAFDEMLRRNPEIAIRIIRKYVKRLREANALLDRLAGHRVDLDQAPASDDRVREKAQHRLVDVASGTAFFLSRGDETTIGRADPVTGILPDIDLTPVDTSRSVSRRHAKILHRPEGYSMLEEVGTVNGTFVNDERITTGVPAPVANGDRVRIGLIEMRILFEE
jgi:CRP-like cAMP-binding protein